MNHHLPLIILLLVGPCAALHAQSSENTKTPRTTPKEHTLVYDHENGDGMVLRTAPLQLDDNIRVRVTNVNRLMYQVTITGNNKVFESEPPPGIMTLLGFQVAKEAEASETTDNVTDPSTTQPSAAANELNAAEEKLRKITQQLDRDELVQQGLKDLSDRFQQFTDGVALSTTKTFLTTQVTQADSMVAQNSAKRAERDSLQARVATLRTSIQQGAQDQGRYDQSLKDLKTSFKGFGNAFEELERMKSLYNKLVGIAYHEGFDLAETGKLLAEVIKDMPYVNDKEKLVRLYEDAQQTMDEALEEFRDVAAQQKKAKDETERLVKPIVYRFNKLKASATAYDYVKLFQNIDELYWTLQDPSMFTVVSDPVQATGDVVDFTVEIKGRTATSALTSLVDRDFSHTEYVRGGIRHEWSSGIMFQAGLNDQVFRLEPKSDDPTQVTVLKNDDRELFKPAVAGLLHVGPRVEKHFRVGGIVGAGLNETDLEKVTFYLGAGLGFGRREKVYVNFGLAGRQVDVLSGAYDEGQVLPVEGSEDLTLTESVFRIGGFFGVTMVLGKQNKEDGKQK